MKFNNYIIGLSIIVSSIIISISMVVAYKSSNKNKIEEIIKLEECGSKRGGEYTSKNYFKEHSFIINLKDKVVRHIEVTADGEILHPLYHITDITDDRVFTNDKFEFVKKFENYEISTSINFKTGNVTQIYRDYRNHYETEYFCEIKKNQSKRPLTKIVKFKIGFSLKIPADYIQLNSDKNLNKILDDYKGKEVDKNYLEKMLSMLNQNPTYDYFINSNFSPDSNSINFNYIVDGGSTINNYQKLGYQKTCSLLQNQISQIYNQNKEQFYCGYSSSNMKNKLGDVLKIVHEGRLPNQKMIQYQFQYEDKLVTATLACNEKNCDVMDRELIEILNSIQ